MSPKPQTLADRLRIAMAAHPELSQSELGRRVGAAPQTIQSLLSKESKNSRFVPQIADVLGVSAIWLATGRGPMHSDDSTTPSGTSVRPQQTIVSSPAPLRPIRVVGHVQAGSFREAVEWPHDQQWEVYVPVSPSFSTLPLSALEVRGPSMDLLYPHGSIVICVKYFDLGRDPVAGERVVAHRTMPNGLIEASVKEFRVDRDGQARLWPRSNHPDFQAPVSLIPPPGETLTVTHLVVGSYRPEA